MNIKTFMKVGFIVLGSITFALVYLINWQVFIDNGICAISVHLK